MANGVRGASDADAGPRSCAESPPGVVGVLRVVGQDILFCAGVAVVLTLLLLADEDPTLADWLEQGIRVVSITQQLDFAGAANDQNPDGPDKTSP